MDDETLEGLLEAFDAGQQFTTSPSPSGLVIRPQPVKFVDCKLERESR